jgi:hypothetical protein
MQVLKLKPWSEEDLMKKLVSSVEFSILHDGYHWSIPSSAQGWKAVMWKYKDMVKDFQDKQKAEKAKVKVSGDKKRGLV